MAARSGWGGLGLFWGALLVAAAGLGVTLQVMGPPLALHSAASGPATPGLLAKTASATAPQPAAASSAVPKSAAPKQVAPPEAALLEPSPHFPPAQLPRVAADGRVARVVYAAPAPALPAGTPRIAILIDGFGLSEQDSRAALAALPGAVSLAVSAYAGAPPALYAEARAGGHELLASIPMEPEGYPLSDEGARSLLTGLSPADNQLNLEWSLGRMPGAVGATAASDGMRGARFSDVVGALDPVLDAIGRRGLLYIDPRPGRTPHRPDLAARAVDVVLDDPPARAEIEAKLVSLERIAREHGSAMGLAGPLRPVTIERIAAWAATLRGRGLVLVPVSALVPVRAQEQASAPVTK